MSTGLVIVFELPPGVKGPEGFAWPTEWPVPRIGESVYMGSGITLEVEDVCWEPPTRPEEQPRIFISLKD